MSNEVILQLIIAVVTGAVTLLGVSINITRRLDKRLATEEKKSREQNNAHKKEIETLKLNHANELKQKDIQITEALDLAKAARKNADSLYELLQREKEERDTERRTTLDQHDSERREMTKTIEKISDDLESVADDAKTANERAERLEDDLKNERVYRERIEEERNTANNLLGEERKERQQAEAEYKKLVAELRKQIGDGEDERGQLLGRLKQSEKDRGNLNKRIDELEKTHVQTQQSIIPVPVLTVDGVDSSDVGGDESGHNSDSGS